MARSNFNTATHGLSGRVDQFVFRQRNGKTFVSKIPKMDHIIPSEGQVKCRERFKIAAALAKAKLAEPGMKEYYLSKAAPGQSAYIVAFSAFYAQLA